MQNPMMQESFVLIEKPNGELCIGVEQPKIQNLVVQCYQCQRKNQCSCRAQFLKCGYCNTLNKVSDTDPLFYVEVLCQRCSKQIKIPKNASIYRCPFCQQINKKYQR